MTSQVLEERRRTSQLFDQLQAYDYACNEHIAFLEGALERAEGARLTRRRRYAARGGSPFETLPLEVATRIAELVYAASPSVPLISPAFTRCLRRQRFKVVRADRFSLRQRRRCAQILQDAGSLVDHLYCHDALLPTLLINLPSVTRITLVQPAADVGEIDDMAVNNALLAATTVSTLHIGYSAVHPSTGPRGGPMPDRYLNLRPLHALVSLHLSFVHFPSDTFPPFLDATCDLLSLGHLHFTGTYVALPTVPPAEARRPFRGLKTLRVECFYDSTPLFDETLARLQYSSCRLELVNMHSTPLNGFPVACVVSMRGRNPHTWHPFDKATTGALVDTPLLDPAWPSASARPLSSDIISLRLFHATRYEAWPSVAAHFATPRLTHLDVACPFFADLFHRHPTAPLPVDLAEQMLAGMRFLRTDAAQDVHRLGKTLRARCPALASVRLPVPRMDLGFVHRWSALQAALERYIAAVEALQAELEIRGVEVTLVLSWEE